MYILTILVDTLAVLFDLQCIPVVVLLCSIFLAILTMIIRVSAFFWIIILLRVLCETWVFFVFLVGIFMGLENNKCIFEDYDCLLWHIYVY